MPFNLIVFRANDFLLCRSLLQRVKISKIQERSLKVILKSSHSNCVGFINRYDTLKISI